MRFINKLEVPIRHSINNRKYVVQPGETVNIPDRFAYVIQAEGVNLTPVDEKALAALLAPSAPDEKKGLFGLSLVASKRPCIEEFLHAGYAAEEYDVAFKESDYGAGWSNPDWKPEESLESLEKPAPTGTSAAPEAAKPSVPTRVTSGDIDTGFSVEMPAKTQKPAKK
jgi:hypothetical protein